MTLLYFVEYSTVSIRVFTTERGHKRTTEIERAAAPESRVAPLDSVPSEEDNLEVMAFKVMKYTPTPVVFRRTDGVTPRHKPERPSWPTIARKVLIRPAFGSNIKAG